MKPGDPLNQTNHATLTDRLRRRIKEHGPISFCEWMQAALYDEFAGYYRRIDRNRWGREGDYRTSPERSSLFSATCARYFAGLHNALGQPAEWTILEAGAGNGNFACGVLKTLHRDFPRVFASTRYLIDELGEPSEGLIHGTLTPFADRIRFQSVCDATIEHGVVFSNELLDAFPVHRVTCHQGRLREFFVDVGPDDGFVWQTDQPSSSKLAAYLDRAGVQLADGQIAEINLAAEDWLRSAASSIENGYVMTIDYGGNARELYSAELRPKGTLRGFQHHRLVENVLANPGEQDLTSSVNWTSLQQVGELLGLETIAFERQDKFLLSAGLLTQLQLETQSAADEAERASLTIAAREMILPDGMATSFQVLVQGKAAG